MSDCGLQGKHLPISYRKCRIGRGLPVRYFVETMDEKTSFKELTRKFHYLEDEFHRATNWSYRAALMTEMAKVIQGLESITNIELNSIIDSVPAKQHCSAVAGEMPRVADAQGNHFLSKRAAV